jgi:FlaA1/EpsC-like NDP-sugar epimerase
VNPTNVMGATKRAAELFIQAFAPTAPQTRFSLVRFGNVLGSKGSVAPLFEAPDRRGRPRHRHPPRHDALLHERGRGLRPRPPGRRALRAFGLGPTHALYVLDMGEPVRVIAELAEKMIRMKGLTPGQDILMRVTGPRPGEKLTETVFYDREQVRAPRWSMACWKSPGADRRPLPKCRRGWTPSSPMPPAATRRRRCP